MAKDSSDKQLNNKGTKRGLHPNSLKNLEKGRKPWKCNQSGNPRGRPPNVLCITSRQKAMLSEVCPFDAQHRTWLDALAEAGMRMALVKPEAMRDFMDRHWGKVTQPIGGEGGGPIEVEHDAKGKLLSLLNRFAARAGEDKGDKQPNPEGS